ncbi:hypothetical protein DFH09DRAFT_940628, partial [Mycena vulgaris]
DRILDSREDPFDQCAAGPFVLGHVDLNPWNMIFCPEGPNAGKIVLIIDWEISLTVALWSLVCRPLWFDRVSASEARDSREAQHFKDTYIRQLQKHARKAIVLHVVQNAQYEARRRFSEIAILPWDAAEVMEVGWSRTLDTDRVFLEHVSAVGQWERIKEISGISQRKNEASSKCTRTLNSS